MLRHLHIRDFAIIPELELSFSDGFNVFTGETGAGKSIILDAVSAVLGGKTDMTLVREGAPRASVEAVFSLQDCNRIALFSLLKREELADDADPDELVLTREIRAEGRSTARLNGHTININLMREVGALLVDIHGQADHLSLLNPASHIGLLDRFADNAERVKTYRTELKLLQKVRSEQRMLEFDEEESLRRRDILTFQLNEIDSAALSEQEEEELLEERNRLSNAEALNLHVRKCLENLEGRGELPGILDLSGAMTKSMEQLSRWDATLLPLYEQVISAHEQLIDTASELRHYRETLEFHPRRLEWIEERLQLYATLKRKYGGSLSAVCAFREKAAYSLETLDNAEERLTDLAKQEQEHLRSLSVQAQTLSARRKEAAAQVSRHVEQELAELQMKNASFAINFQTQPAEHEETEGNAFALNENGFDEIEFLIAPNLGEGLKPLAKIASGGETSRLMLALKNTLANADELPTMIFDEIDQGIGGRIGAIVGEKLWQLSRFHQTLCITHLPQLAAFYDTHYHVMKQVADGRTQTVVRQLPHEESLHELALLMGADSPENLSAADAMRTEALKTKNNKK